MDIETLHNKAREAATRLENFFAGCITVRFAMSKNVTVSGAISCGHDRISVPVNIFCFDTFKDYDVRVILNRATFRVINIIK